MIPDEKLIIDVFWNEQPHLEKIFIAYPDQ